MALKTAHRISSNDAGCVLLIRYPNAGVFFAEESVMVNSIQHIKCLGLRIQRTVTYYGGASPEKQ